MGFNTTGGDNPGFLKWNQITKQLCDYTDDELITELNRRRLEREAERSKQLSGWYNDKHTEFLI